ncbi:MAG: DUF3006 domain-containing protein [Gemmatimonadales bacterium]|jgi:hypothetical protein
MPTERYYAVDRIEGTIAVLIDDHGHSASVPVDRLPRGVDEGVVLRVTFEAENVPNWSRSTLDVAETQRRKQEAQGMLEQLEGRDPGGDVEA